MKEGKNSRISWAIMSESSADLRAEKQEIQAAFIESCKARGLTPYEALREASFLPLDLKPTDIKVTKWPRFR